MYKKIKRIISLLKNDKRSHHHLEVNKSYINENFDFFINKKKLPDKLINRIFTFAKSLIQQEENFKKDDMWNFITSQNDHKEFIDVCIRGDIEKFNQTINSANKTKLTQGFLNYYNYEDLISSKKNRLKESTQFIDKLISIAEYKKDINVFNPEQGNWIVKEDDYSNLIKKVFCIDNRTIKPFISPNYTYGLKNDKYFYSLKDLKSFYTAIRIKEILKNHKLKQINEIGAGLGFLPYYSSKINKTFYNVFDLPLVLILQSYYLILSLGEEKIHLWGEEKKDSNIISLNPYWSVFESNTDGILWINQDSLPEIDIKLSKKYISKIFSSNRSYFLSINQEAKDLNTFNSIQNPVHELIDPNIDLNLIYRSRDFLRKGYIEELYFID